MTPHSFFTILIKTFGLVISYQIINSFFQLISSAIESTSMDSAYSSIIILGTSIFVLLFYVFLSFKMIFRTQTIISFFNLDKDFKEERFSFDIKKDEILRIAIIVISGYLLLNEIPKFLQELYFIISLKTNSNYISNSKDYIYSITSGAKIIIGFLLIGERNKILDFINLKNENK